MTALTTPPAEASPATKRPWVGLVLWLTSIGVFIASVVLGIVLAMTSEGSTAGLAVIFAPVLASIAYAPLNVAALIVTIAGFRRPGKRAAREYVALIGSSITVLFALAIFLFMVLAYGGNLA